MDYALYGLYKLFGDKAQDVQTILKFYKEYGFGQITFTDWIHQFSIKDIGKVANIKRDPTMLCKNCKKPIRNKDCHSDYICFSCGKTTCSCGRAFTMDTKSNNRCSHCSRNICCGCSSAGNNQFSQCLYEIPYCKCNSPNLCFDIEIMDMPYICKKCGRDKCSCGKKFTSSTFTSGKCSCGRTCCVCSRCDDNNRYINLRSFDEFLPIGGNYFKIINSILFDYEIPKIITPNEQIKNEVTSPTFPLKYVLEETCYKISDDGEYYTYELDKVSETFKGILILCSCLGLRKAEYVKTDKPTIKIHIDKTDFIKYLMQDHIALVKRIAEQEDLLFRTP